VYALYKQIGVFRTSSWCATCQGPMHEQVHLSRTGL
jgi:hypothetical protein